MAFYDESADGQDDIQEWLQRPMYGDGTPSAAEVAELMDAMEADHDAWMDQQYDTAEWNAYANEQSRLMQERISAT